VASCRYWSRRAFSSHISRALLNLTTRVPPPSTLRFVRLTIASMSGRLRTITASASALLQLSSATLADPTITAPAVLPRQNSDTFIGYVELNNTCTSSQDGLRVSLTVPQGAALIVSPAISKATAFYMPDTLRQFWPYMVSKRTVCSVLSSDSDTLLCANRVCWRVSDLYISRPFSEFEHNRLY
jgi:hypothetical protein